MFFICACLYYLCGRKYKDYSKICVSGFHGVQIFVAYAEGKYSIRKLRKDVNEVSSVLQLRTCYLGVSDWYFPRISILYTLRSESDKKENVETGKLDREREIERRKIFPACW